MTSYPSTSSITSLPTTLVASVSGLISGFARKVGDTADVVHRSAAPVDLHGGAPTPAFLTQAIDDIHMQIVNGKPFSIGDLPAYFDAVKNLNGVGIDDRLMLLEKILVLMSRLGDGSPFARQLQNYVITTLYKDLPHPPAAYLPVSVDYDRDAYKKRRSPHAVANANGNASHANGGAASNGDNAPNGNGSAPGSPSSLHEETNPYNPNPHARAHARLAPAMPYAARSADGSDYNQLLPTLGQARRPYARTVPPLTPRGKQALPDAELVFDTLLKRAPNSSAGQSPGEAGVKTDDTGFTAHPGGISSLFFAFADLIIHSCFNTDHAEWSVNNASSYLDLCPLYGSDKEGIESVRRRDGTGRLWDDVFADRRVLFMPPNVCALLILFCRNHNFIAEKLLAINEWGTYANPAAISGAQRDAQDNELFERARLVNCGFFMQVILGDYVGAILGLVRDGLDWRLDPLSEMREASHEVAPRGQGNVVSIEFNLLYRWHAALSKQDTQWTEKVFADAFGTTDFSSITVEKFLQVVPGIVRKSASGSVREWSFEGPDGKKLERDPETKGFRDADLAALLQNATEWSASAFKARGIPEVLRVVEIMGIQQARSWGACSLNEFRKFMGLKPYANFKEWNPDPTIYEAAEALYEHIDNLELHVGMQAEEAKPSIPGSGLCPGYTISRSILADAVALTRGDRFLTTDFTTYNLTAWGYQDCYPDKNDGSYGGMLTRLLFRALPEYYPAGSAYAHFPFLVPERVKEFLKTHKDSPVKKYTYTRPPVPVAPTAIVETYEGVKSVLERRDVFESGVERRLADVTRGTRVDPRLVNDILVIPEELMTYKDRFGNIMQELIKIKSVEHIGSKLKYVDIVKDVINMLPVYFVSTQLAGIPLKTDATPHGVYRDKEVYDMFADICDYVYLNTDPGQTWVLRERAVDAADRIVKFIRDCLRTLSGRSIIGDVVHWFSGADNANHAFLKRVLALGRNQSIDELAYSVLAAVVGSAALYSKAAAHIVDFYLEGKYEAEREELVQVAKVRSADSDALLVAFAREALRLAPAVPSITRVAKSNVTLRNGTKVRAGQKVYSSLTKANVDNSVFGPNAYSIDYERAVQGLTGLADYGLVNAAFFEETIPQVLRSVFGLKGLTRVQGDSGKLAKVEQTVHGCPEVSYVNLKSQITPWPVSLKVQYKP